MIDNQYLAPATLLDAPVALYGFEQLRPSVRGRYSEADLNRVLSGSKRATARIIEQVISLAQNRQQPRRGVMIFAATVAHAREIYGYLPADCSAVILGDMKPQARDSVIAAFKQQQIRFLVNVSVLTTGFDAPHVDLIAILRPTESVSLYQQIVGRGLRLFDGKTDCLVMDYAGNTHSLFHPEVGEAKPDSDSRVVTVPCPVCDHNNQFWGLLDNDGDLIEHYGRRCQGLVEREGEKQQCDFRYRFKECGQCGAENDIAARQCHRCQQPMVDPDDKLKAALQLRDAMVLRCCGISFESVISKKGQPLLKVSYHDEDGAELSELFGLGTDRQKKAFQQLFLKQHLKDRNTAFYPKSPDHVITNQHLLRAPDFVIARQKKRYWAIRDKLFDYQGKYRRANQL